MATPAARVPRRWLWLVLGSVLPLGCWREVRPPRGIEPEESWMGAYFGNQKIGFMHTRVRPSQWQGEPAVEVESTSVVKVSLMGNKMEENIHSLQVTDPSFAPLHLSFTMTSGQRTRSVLADFFPDRIECQMITPENATETKTIPIAEGVRLVADEQTVLEDKAGSDLKEGEALELYQFNPVTLTIDRVALTLLRRERLPFEGEERPTLVFEHRMPMADSLIWVEEESGDVLKMTSLQVITFVRESEQEAIRFPEAREALVDLALALSVRPQQPIPRPHGVRRLEMQIWGLETLGEVPSDDWQQIEGTPRAGEPVRVTIRSQSFPPEQAVDLPFEEETLQPYLQPADYIEADHPEIIEQARQIVGEERNAWRAASLIRAWIHQRVEWRYDIGVIRSALQILRDPAGVCRDASVLFAALARAAGIPTRVCVGLTYVRDGFYGHAWAEVYVGDGRWVAFDPTLATDTVDATHFKLGQGQYTRLFQTIKALPGMKIEVVEVKYDE